MDIVMMYLHIFCIRHRDPVPIKTGDLTVVNHGIIPFDCNADGMIDCFIVGIIRGVATL